MQQMQLDADASSQPSTSKPLTNPYAAFPEPLADHYAYQESPWRHSDFLHALKNVHEQTFTDSLPTLEIMSLQEQYSQKCFANPYWDNRGELYNMKQKMHLREGP